MNEKIELNKFQEIYKLFGDELSDSLEKIQYLPYIYFKLKCDDKKTEKNCIEILMKNVKEIKDFIGDCFMNSETNTYYIIDLDFWISWCDYVNWDNINIETDIRPRINTLSIATANGILYQGLIYLKDYIIVTEKMYELFKSWFICLGPDLPRYKIEKIIEKKVTKDKQIITKKEKIFEMEIYPVFVKVFNMEEIINKVESNDIKEHLHQLCTEIVETGGVIFPYSKYITFKDMLKALDSTGKARIWIFYDNKFYTPSVDKKLEEESLNDFVLIVLEYSKNSKWMSESLDITSLKKKKISLSSRAFVGITNIGNSKILLTQLVI